MHLYKINILHENSVKENEQLAWKELIGSSLLLQETCQTTGSVFSTVPTVYRLHLFASLKGQSKEIFNQLVTGPGGFD